MGTGLMCSFDLPARFLGERVGSQLFQLAPRCNATGRFFVAPFSLQSVLPMTTTSSTLRNSPRDILNSLFNAATTAALPAHTLAQYLPKKPKGRTIVIGAGKAAA